MTDEEITTGLEREIKAMQADVSSIKERLESIEVQLSIELASVNQRLAEIRALLNGSNQPKSPEP
jgi:flagellar motor switch/type III secretory pathway protein FliN